MDKRIAVTITTINIPHVVDELISNKLKYHPDCAIDFIIVGDMKTPSSVGQYLDLLEKNSGSNILYLDLDQQEHLFKGYADLWEHIPINSFARRNFGDLYAYLNGYEIIIRIDDDNFPYEDTDFFGPHLLTGTVNNMSVINNVSGWHNICDVLIEKSGAQFYPRGYPYDMRWIDQSTSSINVKKIEVMINAGLWFGDPDIDAITRICKPLDVINFDQGKYGSSYALDLKTWSPINTQNTAFHRELIPAAFISPWSGRYDDIFSGYFLRAIMDHLGHYVTYGLPIVNQIRNEHNLWSDLEKEMLGNTTCPRLCEILKKVELKNNSYAECFLELIEKSRKDINTLDNRYSNILDGMEIWANVFLNK